MTTILADLRQSLMVSDSSISDGDRIWLGRKVWRCQGALLGFSGEVDEAHGFLHWWRRGQTGARPKFSHSEALVLLPGVLLHFSGSLNSIVVPGGREGIGTGSKAAICAYEAMGWTDARRAVRIACRHDAESRVPVRVYHL